MRSWIYAAIAVVPFGLLVGQLYDINQWQGWALIVAGFWWREVGASLDRRLDKP
jgi:hypothetical protein